MIGQSLYMRNVSFSNNYAQQASAIALKRLAEIDSIMLKNNNLTSGDAIEIGYAGLYEFQNWRDSTDNISIEKGGVIVKGVPKGNLLCGPGQQASAVCTFFSFHVSVLKTRAAGILSNKIDAFIPRRLFLSFFVMFKNIELQNANNCVSHKSFNSSHFSPFLYELS